MNVFVENVLEHPDLSIDLFKEENGKLIYVGTSNKYEPKNATSNTSALRCFLKFDIPIAEQKLIAAAFKS